jgi:predicted DNA-binding transcriptional regulator YafY
MSRAARLLSLVDTLRRYRRPVTASTLAEELGVSPRSVYRDVATLRAQGAQIEGEAGVGYVLRPGFLLPPLMFSDEELDSLVLGLRLCAEHGDDELAKAAHGVMSKVRAVLPRDLARHVDEAALFAGPHRALPPATIDLVAVRRSIRDARKVAITYSDARDRTSERIIWPLGLAYFEQARLVVAWCENRVDFRTFRVDRISKWEPRTEPFDQPRRTLLTQWKARIAGEGVTPRSFVG